MGKKIIILLLGLCLAITLKAQEPGANSVSDSLGFGKLDGMLEKYTAAIAQEKFDVKSAECDFLISSVHDSLTTQHIALWLYDHYKDSELMGDEAVAIHIYDNWFKPGTIAMRSQFDRFDADLFASFNRSTLLGMKAPEVTLQTPCGRKIKVPEQGSHAILYCGHDKKAWRKFRNSFKVRNKKVGIVHAWDPEVASDYLRLYGVMSTPRLYFTDTDGEILGRRLEVESLAEIINYICDYYGKKEKQ